MAGLTRGIRLTAAALAVFVATAAQAEEILTVGVIAPLSGAGAAWGAAAKESASILGDSINANGGLDVGGTRYTIKVIAYDDQYKAAEAVAAYNRLVNQDGVRFLMIATSAPAMAVKDSIEADDVLAITSAFAPAAIDDNTKHMVRIYSTATDYLPSYIKWMGENLSKGSVVTINPNDETGWGQSKSTATLFAENGFTVLSSELYERTTQDFAPQLTKVIAMSPDMIDVGSSSPATAGLIVRQARELGFKGQFLQTGGAGWAQIVDAAGAEAAEGLVNVLYSDPTNEGLMAVAKEYETRVGQAPNDVLAPYYDGFNVLFAAIQKAGTVDDIDAIVAAFPQVLPMKSVQGTDLVWTGKMQIKSTEFVSILKDGAPNVVGTIQ